MEKNAIIMAAGKSNRFAPFTYEKPKGLFIVRGEVLIERQIEQLLEAGIDDIYVVIGYMKEKFFYLERKYPQVKLVINNTFGKYGNIYSLYVTRQYLKNTYICCADHYFIENPFKEDNDSNDSYRACTYLDDDFMEFSVDHALILMSMSSVCAEVGNFTQLNEDLSVSVELNDDYIKSPSEGSINLSESKSINGNGHIIESNDTVEFNIDGNSTHRFNNITFKCNRIVFTLENITGSAKVTFNNCKFLPSNGSDCIEAHMYGYDWGYGKSCEVSSEIKNMALKIIGDSKDLKAAKKLAVWVAKNVKYEKRAGFYQSPTETLKRLLGICCCQSDLLLQMMDAVGLCKNHRICYVHVGSNHYLQRHYFLTIDNLCVDPTLRSPWGHGKFSGMCAESMEYPIMPLPYGDYA